jgi:phage/plasmid-like protein (TIGR03299 family)
VSSEFESGVFNRRGAWHGLGRVWQPTDDEPVLTPLIAMKLSRLAGWGVHKDPIMRNGVHTGRYWIVRGTDDKILGHSVSKQYEIIQNEEGFSYLDQLIDAGDLEIETAISLYGGRMVTVLARKPEGLKIAGDAYDTYIGYTGRHDGLGANKVYTCRERIVCANTQSIAEGEFKRSGRHWSIRHQGDTTLKLADARKALELSFEEDKAYAAALEEMATKKFDNDSYKEFMVELTGLRKIDAQKQPRKYRNTLDTYASINNIRRTAEDLDLFRDRYLGAYQAISQFETHNKDYRNDTTKFQKLVVEGGELTNRAFKLLTA